MTKMIVLTALLMASAAAPALAQDAGWTGAYVGGRIGHAFQPNRNGETVLFDRDLDGRFGDTISTAAGSDAFGPGFCGGASDVPVPGNCEKDKDGIEYAIHVGYDYQFGGGFVVGLVGDYGSQDGRDSVTAFSTSPAYYALTRKLRDSYSIRARAGYGTEDALFYATGGVAWGKIKNEFDTNNMVNSFTNSGNDTAQGYRLGAGAEYRVGPTFTIGLQYLYTRLDDGQFRVRAGNNGMTPATNPFVRGNPAGTDFARSADKLTTSSLALTGSFRF